MPRRKRAHKRQYTNFWFKSLLNTVQESFKIQSPQQLILDGKLQLCKLAKFAGELSEISCSN